MLVGRCDVKALGPYPPEVVVSGVPRLTRDTDGPVDARILHNALLLWCCCYGTVPGRCIVCECGVRALWKEKQEMK